MGRLAQAMVLALLALPVDAEDRPSDTTGASGVELVLRLLSNDEPRLHSYRALRRLEAANDRHHKSAWLDAWTELTPAGFRYEIIAAGGSDLVRRRVLEASLRTEQQMWARGEIARSDLTPANYDFEAAGFSQDGLLRVAIKPRRKDDMLVDGTVFVEPRGRDIVRLEGRLVKSPSFWTRQVQVVRKYDRIGGVRVPVRCESTAQVRLAGPSRMVITYEYETVNGRVVGTPMKIAEKP